MKTTGLFLPSESALQLNAQIETLLANIREARQQDIFTHQGHNWLSQFDSQAMEALRILQSGEAGEYQVLPTQVPPILKKSEASDLITHAANLARAQAGSLPPFPPIKNLRGIFKRAGE